VAVAGLSARLYRDHNIDRQLAFDLRRRAFDVTYASEVGKERARDEEHLRWAASEGRALVTYDVRDFRILAEEWAATGRDHAGIIISQAPPYLVYGNVLRRLLLLLNSLSAEQLTNQVQWLDAGWDTDH
jgi:hypothetical protein